MQQLFTTQRSLKLLKGRGPPRFSLRRYQHILDLLATLIPTTYSLSHRSDKNPVFGLTSTGHHIKSFEDFVYIGLRRNTRTGKWYWTDGSQVNYTKWAVHQPDHPESEHCAQLHQDPGPGLIYVEDRKWNSIPCDRPMKYFVCKR
ncbi:hypothetical protein Y032_0005g2379 [Ancylostoma ceylanicum]|nr:hypothetical protein Y032_0005g2379 [Ancylostoma ceylanicum]